MIFIHVCYSFILYAHSRILQCMCIQTETSLNAHSMWIISAMVKQNRWCKEKTFCFSDCGGITSHSTCTCKSPAFLSFFSVEKFDSAEDWN